MADTAQITRIKAELAKVDAAIEAQYDNGEEHSIIGSHSFKGVNYIHLMRRKHALENQLAAANGGTSSIYPDFS